MKILSHKLNLVFRNSLIITGLLFSTLGHAQDVTFEAHVNEIGKDYIVTRIDGESQKYELSNLFYPATKYYANGQETSFETLYGVGYIDKARITVSDGKVRRLEVIELYQ